MVQLPPELIDAILDHLHDDKRALSACSLVHTTWTHTARYHLFADVRIDVGRMNGLRLLQPGSAAIPYIRHLRIMVNVGRPFWNETLPSLAGFERIQSVSIACLPWGFMKPRARSAFLNHFATATRLCLYKTNTTLTSLAHMITAFSRLDTLVINQIYPSRLVVLQSPPPESTPRNLHALELCNCDAHVLLSWLGSSGISLRSVSLRRISANDIQPFLDAIGPSLEEFWCEPYFEPPHGASSPP
jgi:hypothetical protein